MSDLTEDILRECQPPYPCRICNRARPMGSEWGMMLLADHQRYLGFCVECSNAIQGFVQRRFDRAERHREAREREFAAINDEWRRVKGR